MRSPRTSDPPEALPRVGRYEILLDLQDEGFVSLMAARVRGPNPGSSLVELAKVERSLAREAEVKAAFLAEARAAGRVRHANFVHPTDTLIHEGDLYGATEFTLGVRLDELWRAAAAAHYEIPPPVILRIILDVLSGLSALHARHSRGATTAGSRSIVHGDVAPGNILVSYRGDARVLHSGLSCVTSRAGVLAQQNRRLAYKAPEQLRMGVNAVPIGPPADVFAVGVLLWEALHGQRLFEASSDAEVVERILHGERTSVEGDTGRIPIALLPLIEMALERTPERRIPNAAQLGDSIEHAPGVRLASSEEVAHVVDHLVGRWIERRRELIDELFAHAEANSPSDSTLRPAIVSHLRRVASMKTPVGLVYPPPLSNAPPARPRSTLPSERWIDASSLAPPRVPFSEMDRDIGPDSSPGRRWDRSGSVRLGETRSLRARLTPRGTMGWLYYVALGAMLGGLVFEFGLPDEPAPPRAPASPSAVTAPGTIQPGDLPSTGARPPATAGTGAVAPAESTTPPEPVREPSQLWRAHAATRLSVPPATPPVAQPPAKGKGPAPGAKPPAPAPATKPAAPPSAPAEPVDSEWGI